ncbi:nuclear body protein SP140-like protein isoform X2 [Sebastes fasciatus]|uniref:nuclear body protein SP140-like protein isoform X2 n=1 Tax=Sebastes fasciatus TaxID=394691 RepID=UPI003D9E0BBA
MDPMDWLKKDDLLRFFRRHKTEMSSMENPHMFLNQLRDHDLVPEDHYKEVSRMKSKDNIKKGLYGILDWLEKERSKSIKDFWRCVFRETILNQYPTLRELRNRLMDGSFHFETQEPETVETEETDEGKRKDLSDDEEGEENQASSVKKKRKLRSEKSVCDDEEEQAGPSSCSSPRKKSQKISFSSPLKKGEKNDIWTWTMFKHQFPVTCGEKEGTLNKDRLAKGEKCIAVEKQWFTPKEFETFAGRKSCKNWKWSIRCKDTSLGKLIKDGHLKAGNYRRKCKKAKTSLFPSGDVVTDEQGEEQPEQQPQASSDSGRKANILSIDSPNCTYRNCKPSVTDLVSQKNDDKCSICKIEEGEELVVCDHCPRSFHQKCHLPHLEDTIFGTYRESSYRDELEREAVMSRQILQSILQCQYLLLYLSSAEEQRFASNRCLHLQNYSTVIKTPMWLGNIADKLQDELYKTVGEFVSDVQLIFTNCASYNRDNAEYLAAGNRLKELFDGEMKSVFNISE